MLSKILLRDTGFPMSTRDLLNLSTWLYWTSKCFSVSQKSKRCMSGPTAK